ncbi:MAG TPA: hypothetical protein VMZ30_17760 [Pyrinomonadaceae bacterium]|nr:hypothetical protein [Pyrinomonadaceae bacterium]
MRVQNLMIAALSLLVFSMTCQRFLNKPNATTSLADSPKNVFLKPTSVVINEPGEQIVDFTKIPLTPNEKAAPRAVASHRKIDKVQFANAKTGWAGTDKNLYKTSDGGNSWEHLALNVPDSSHISAFFFIDEGKGWLSLVDNLNIDADTRGNFSRVMITHDGGQSWTEQSNFSDGVMINEIKFLNSTTGLAAGGRIVNASQPYEETFAVSTTDGGKTWKNISNNIKSTAKDGYSRPVSSINWSEPSQVVLLLRGGKVIISSDNGEIWKSLVQFEDVRPNGSVSSTGYYKMVVDTVGNLRVLAGAMGEEGYWGNLITDDDDNSWRSYELIRIPIFDALFLSEKEIVASGWEIKAQDAKRDSDLPAVGILLHSTDGGKSWSAIYRSQSNERFVSLTKVSENRFYAMSDAGTLLRFSLRKT